MRCNDHADEVAIEGIKKLSWPGEDWNDLKMHTATELFRPKPITANKACQPWCEWPDWTGEDWMRMKNPSTMNSFQLSQQPCEVHEISFASRKQIVLLRVSKQFAYVMQNCCVYPNPIKKGLHLQCDGLLVSAKHDVLASPC